MPDGSNLGKGVGVEGLRIDPSKNVIKPFGLI